MDLFEPGISFFLSVAMSIVFPFIKDNISFINLSLFFHLYTWSNNRYKRKYLWQAKLFQKHENAVLETMLLVQIKNHDNSVNTKLYVLSPRARLWHLASIELQKHLTLTMQCVPSPLSAIRKAHQLSTGISIKDRHIQEGPCVRVSHCYGAMTSPRPAWPVMWRSRWRTKSIYALRKRKQNRVINLSQEVLDLCPSILRAYVWYVRNLGSFSSNLI